jgi:hypothetical protein
MLLGMLLCERCARLWMHNSSIVVLGNPLVCVPPDVMAWAILVARIRNEYALERYPLRLATRLAHAKLAELEVDVLDLWDGRPPPLELLMGTALLEVSRC